jgi:hypothetical protein
MFIISGSRGRTKKESMISKDCLLCPNKELQIISIRSWFTFFFIPIFPISSKTYYMECASCENCYKFQDDKDDVDVKWLF